ncbi:MAG: ABC transporter permease [Planctomycetes bacterium]|nr:ABC transporter permease [Planctomycetota bacterium]
MDRTIRILDAEGRHPYLGDCWRHRDLLWFFARRDLVVRYRQTALGIVWVLLRPVLAMGVFGFLFGTVAGLDGRGVPYPLLVLVGMLPWQFFASVLAEGAGAVVNNPALVTKIYFPRMLMPASSLILNTVDLGVQIAFLAAVMAWYGIAPPWQVVFAPLAIVLMAASALGAALWLSALTVSYRDFRALVPIILQFGILATPVAWTVATLPGEWRWWAWLNPLAGPVEWLRWCVLPGMVMPGPKAMSLSIVGALLLLLSGYWYFRRVESRFADVI